MPIEIDVKETGLTISPATPKKKVLPFKEEQLLKGLTGKKAHADELAVLQSREFSDDD